MHATGTHISQQRHVPTISIRPSYHSIPRSPGLAEKRCHDIAHRHSHPPASAYLESTVPPLLAATFRSRSFACFTFGRFTGTCNLGVDRGSAFWASPASSHAQYARRTWDTDHATRITIDAGDTGIVVPDCTVPPFRTPCARCSSLVSTSAPMVSALTIEASEARSRLDLPGDSESSLRLCRRHCHRLCRRDSWLLDCTSGCARKRCGSIEKRCKDMLALCLFLS